MAGWFDFFNGYDAHKETKAQGCILLIANSSCLLLMALPSALSIKRSTLSVN